MPMTSGTVPPPVYVEVNRPLRESSPPVKIPRNEGRDSPWPRRVAISFAAMSSRERTRRVSGLAGVGAVGMFLAGACSSGTSLSTTSTTVPAAAESTTSSTTIPSAGSTSGVAAAAPIPADQVSTPGTFGKRPAVKVPSGSPPSQLESSDLIVGTGATAQSGQTVTVQYDGYSWTTKKEFDASWNRGQTFNFPLGQGQVIQGWDQGVAGMKVGGRRELIIPPSLAYGAQTPTPAIAANDTLIFVVDLVSVG